MLEQRLARILPLTVTDQLRLVALRQILVEDFAIS